MEENMYLLANPNHYYKKRVIQESLDDKLLILLKRKFPGIDITKEDYRINILKIESLFNETYKQRVVETVVEEIIRQTENEQILF
jgi:hypothetical protein